MDQATERRAAFPGNANALPPTLTLDYKTPRAERTAAALRPPVIRVLLASLVLMPLTILAICPIVRLLPFGWDAAAFATVQTQHPGQYGGTAGFHIVARGTGRGDGTRLTSAYVVYSGTERPGQMDVDLTTMSYRLGLYGYEHIPARPLTPEAVRDYISRGGFDPATSEGQAVADAILTELLNLSTGVLPPDLTDQPYARQIPAIRYAMAGTHLVDLGEYGFLIWLPWYWPVCLPVWILASILIGRAMLRRYHRRLAEAIRAAGV